MSKAYWFVEPLSVLVLVGTDLKKDSLVKFSSVAQLCPTLPNPIDYSTPGFPVHHQLPDLAQTHVHQVGDAI